MVVLLPTRLLNWRRWLHWFVVRFIEEIKVTLMGKDRF
jgi:hypothetical protein